MYDQIINAREGAYTMIDGHTIVEHFTFKGASELI